VFVTSFLNKFIMIVVLTRRLKAIPWDALARERCIGMNCEVTVKCND